MLETVYWRIISIECYVQPPWAAVKGPQTSIYCWIRNNGWHSSGNIYSPLPYLEAKLGFSPIITFFFFFFVMQKVESDLASRVGSLFQQRLALSVENNKLKQKVIRLQQKKLFADGEFIFFFLFTRLFHMASICHIL